MKTLNQFSAKQSYVTPFAKAVEIEVQSLVCQSLYDEYGLQKLSGDDVQDQTNGWGLGL